MRIAKTGKNPYATSGRCKGKISQQ